MGANAGGSIESWNFFLILSSPVLMHPPKPLGPTEFHVLNVFHIYPPPSDPIAWITGTAF